MADQTGLPLGAQLDIYLRNNGMPITGIRMVDRTDRSTWTVEWAPTATAANKAALPGLIAAFVAGPESPSADPRQL